MANETNHRYNLKGPKGFQGAKEEVLRDLRLNKIFMPKEDEELFLYHANLSFINDDVYIIEGHNKAVDAKFSNKGRQGYGWERIQIAIPTKGAGVTLVWAFKVPVCPRRH